MSEPEPSKLEYATEAALRWHQRPRVRFVLLAIPIAIGTFTAFFFGGALALREYQDYQDWKNVRSLQQQCLDYSLPPGQVIVDDDPANFKKLLSSDPCYSLQGGNGLPQVVEYEPDVLSQFQGHVSYGGSPIWDTRGFLYLHGRRTPGGKDLLVSCSVLDVESDGGTAFWIEIIKPGKFRTLPASESRTVSAEQVAFPTVRHHKPGQHIEIFAGQSDPTNSSHFTIAYVIDGSPGIIDGWLADDETVKLQVRDGPAILH